MFSSNASFNIDLQNLNIGTLVYVFFVAMIAISAMILPGISGSTILLIFGIYIPIMNCIKAFLGFDFSVFPILFTFARIARKCLEKHRSPTVYAILGLMIGSIYSIVLGPTTLEEPKAMMDLSTFSVIFFIIGGAIIIGLEVLKNILNKNKLRIRKLTPRECFRLMGVDDEGFDKIAKNQSDSSLYHLAGDSIVVNVLMAIFKNLI